MPIYHKRGGGVVGKVGRVDMLVIHALLQHGRWVVTAQLAAGSPWFARFRFQGSSIHL